MNLDLYLLHKYILIFPHAWGFIRRIIHYFIFHQKGAEDLKTSLTSQYEAIKCCLLPDWGDIDFDRLQLKFEIPIHKDLEKILSSFVFSVEHNWRTLIATFRHQIESERTKRQEQPCHWIHSNSGITLNTLREWGKSCWNPSDHNRRTNQEKVKEYRKSQFVYLEIEKPTKEKVPYYNPFETSKESNIRRNRYFREKNREKDIKRVRIEGRFG